MRLFWLFLILAAAAVPGDNRFFTPKGLSEIKTGPSEKSETVRIIKSGTMVLVRSVMTDSLGQEWYLVRVSGDTLAGFTLAAGLEFVGDESKTENLLLLNAREKEDKKRRVAQLKKHPDWPRRIRRTIRDGAICLKMTVDQLIVSWQSPYCRTKGFILGTGDVQIFFYRPKNPIAVVIRKDEIVGWSEKAL
jgi:hypothetical protein